MPTDVQGVEEALLHEEERSGEDGEVTTLAEEEPTDGTREASA
jgi:hypothetical protein